MENWKMSRAGIVNFWYYDDEEFSCEDGRLLLRGANGSGKSVTMQSLVPILFDGNKSPERLDPFGSRARRMESYLLSEGLDVEERTGYLYLEFEKKESHRFMTIGMGMRARKNKKMDTWYFIIHDNRRIGKERDLCLYKNLGDCLPLTQKELENRIGEGGHVYTKRLDYKVAVNDYLFGYKDLIDFDELITLLIQIRSPKLSKEFKPTTMYEIMKNSLITLTEEDLRPMSEAIENMDEVEVKIADLKETAESMTRIEKAYSKYNTYMLVNKAKRFIAHSKELVSQKKEKEKQEKLYEDNLLLLDQLSEQISALAQEEDQLKKKEFRLKEHDLSKLVSEKNHLERLFKELEEKLENKTKRLEEREEKEIDKFHQVKDIEEKLELVVSSIDKQFEEMLDYADGASFDEHDFFELAYKKELEEAYNFSYHEKYLSDYKEKIHLGLDQLKKVDECEKAYDKISLKREGILKSKEAQEQLIRECESQLHEVRLEFAEKAFSWWHHLKFLKIEEHDLRVGVDKVYQYGDVYSYQDILGPVNQSYDQFKGDILRKKSHLSGQKDQIVDNKEIIEKELSQLMAQKDPEPERSVAVEKNRAYLAKEGIPFVPLYKALDFQEDLSEEMKGIIEEAFIDLGILDALIIPPAYREQVFMCDKGMADKYIFSDPQLLSHNLSTYLKVEKSEQKPLLPLINDVLQSIFIHISEKDFFLEPSGRYGLGIVHGKVSKTYQSRFIGYQSRKRYKAELIQHKTQEIQGLEDEIMELEKKIEDFNKCLVMAEEEWRQFPKKDDLDVAYKECITAKSGLEGLKDSLEELTEELEDLYKDLSQAKIILHEKIDSIPLRVNSESFTDALASIEAYRDKLYELIKYDKDKWHLKTLLGQLRGAIGELQEELDELRSDCHYLEQDIKENKDKVKHIESELLLHDYKAVLDELSSCENRLREIPTEHKNILEEQSDKKAENKQLKEALESWDLEIEKAIKQVALYEWAFQSELELAYVVEWDKEKALKNLAKELLVSHGSLLDSGESVMELQEKLNEKFHKESGYLVDYHLKTRRLFKEKPFEGISEEDLTHIERVDIKARLKQGEASFYEMLSWVEGQISEYTQILNQKDRELFEEILINFISRKISGKIFHSEKWVKKIDQLMGEMDTSMGLRFNLRWVPKKATGENQLGTKDLIDILKGEQSLLTQEQKEQLMNHFRSKIQETRNRLNETADGKSFLSTMKEVLDYRQWFEFQLYYTRPNEKKKEMTDNAFFTFSGGEKAMAMYVPLFSAVYAKYQGANDDCPKLVSLDEAFAGVDEKNIQDMFKLLVELDLGFIANSQVLFGDYETVPSLSIYELIRPENVTFVTLIRYLWNGQSRQLVNA